MVLRGSQVPHSSSCFFLSTHFILILPFSNSSFLSLLSSLPGLSSPSIPVCLPLSLTFTSSLPHILSSISTSQVSPSFSLSCFSLIPLPHLALSPLFSLSLNFCLRLLLPSLILIQSSFHPPPIFQFPLQGLFPSPSFLLPSPPSLPSPILSFFHFPLSLPPSPSLLGARSGALGMEWGWAEKGPRSGVATC